MGLPSCLGDIHVAGVVHVPARAVASFVGSVTTSAAAVCRVVMVVGNAEVQGTQAAAGEAIRVHILLGAMGGLDEWTTGTGWSTGDTVVRVLKKGEVQLVTFKIVKSILFIQNGKWLAVGLCG